MPEVLHPAQLLFTEDHPLTSAFHMQFLPMNGKTLTVEVNAPDSFADSGGKLVHTGFNTLLLDTVLGACAIGELEKPQPIATIKLNCTHLYQASIGEALACSATYDGEANGVAYVSGEIRGREDNRLISRALGTFMIGTTTKPLGGK